MKPCQLVKVTNVSAQINVSIIRVKNELKENIWTTCTLKMEAASSIETSVTTYLKTSCHIPEDTNLNLRGCDNFKSRNSRVYSNFNKTCIFSFFQILSSKF